jgi:hypothetical protein
MVHYAVTNELNDHQVHHRAIMNVGYSVIDEAALNHLEAELNKCRNILHTTAIILNMTKLPIS